MLVKLEQLTNKEIRCNRGAVQKKFTTNTMESQKTNEEVTKQKKLAKVIRKRQSKFPGHVKRI